MFIRRAGYHAARRPDSAQDRGARRLSAEKGTLDEQLKRRSIQNELPEPLVPAPLERRGPVKAAAEPATPALSFFNGLGGFSEDGRQYVTVLKKDPVDPGALDRCDRQCLRFRLSRIGKGRGYTWSVNSREHRLTPWSNDPLLDPHSEAFYLRDEASGALLVPAPRPRARRGRLHHGRTASATAGSRSSTTTSPWRRLLFAAAGDSLASAQPRDGTAARR